MGDGLFLFLSHLIGQHSDVVPSLNITLGMFLNIMLAVVCVGYISTLFMLLFPWMPSFISAGISLLFLICAFPFEFLNSKTQNLKSLLNLPKWEYPVMTQLFMLVSSGLGAMQYLIRNYSLILNFSKSQAGRTMVAKCLQLSHTLTASRFAMVGGISSFLLHFLLSYSNWDKYTNFQNENGDAQQYMRLLWGILVFVLFPLDKVVLVATALWIAQYIEFPKGGSLMTKVKESWLMGSIYCLPIGAFLYGLVDFFNSYAILLQLGWLNIGTACLCFAFGVISFVNIAWIWGYNMVRFMHGGVGKKVDANDLFVRLYYCDPSIRRLSIYLKEGLLCALDLLNNRLILGFVSQSMFAIFGVSVRLAVLNICTVCFALNKVVIMFFQSGVDSQEFLSSTDYKYTPMAKRCQAIVKVIEEDLPQIFLGEEKKFVKAI